MGLPDVDAARHRYARGVPFPHLVVDGFLIPPDVAALNEEWPAEADPRWRKEAGGYNAKWSTQELPPKLAALAASMETPSFLSWLERVTGIDGLIADPDRFGGGLHCIPRGGFLRVHVDFNRHPRGWHRRLNVLVYLNETWRKDWGGELELWTATECQAHIAPLGGRMVVFETNGTSWHGHPEPLTCPANVQRRSLALYYYTPEPPPEKARTTVYRKG